VAQHQGPPALALMRPCIGRVHPRVGSGWVGSTDQKCTNAIQSTGNAINWAI